MARIYRVKNPPKIVKEYFDQFYGEKYTFDFYWYKGSKGEKVYGCEVRENGKLYSNAMQATEEDYKTFINIPF